jgi:protoporphyrinogen oxidase
VTIHRSATQRILIIGGGIAGIAAALRARSLDPTCRVTIADATGRLGGKIAGEIADGCVVDGGADVCIGDKLRATHMFDSLGLADQVLRVNPRNLPTYERRGHDLQQSPVRFDGEVLTFATGMQELVTRAVKAMSEVQFHANSEVVELTYRDGCWLAQDRDGATQRADAVVIAVPAIAAAALLHQVAADAADVLASLAYPGTTTVSLAWQNNAVQRALDGTGYLVSDDSGPVSACTWTSSKNPSHAPPGVTLVRCYLRGAHTNATHTALEEVAQVLGITAEPAMTRVYEWSAGIPVYTAAHSTAVRDLESALANWPGLFVAGSTFHGVGIPDCIQSGERAAAVATRYLADARKGEAA